MRFVDYFTRKHFQAFLGIRDTNIMYSMDLRKTWERAFTIQEVFVHHKYKMTKKTGNVKHIREGQHEYSCAANPS